MKYTLILLLAGALSALAQTTNAPRPKVAVVVFENITRSRETVGIENPALQPSRLPLLGSDRAGQMKFDLGLTVERYGELARSLLEHALAGRPEVELLERKRVTLLQREVDLNRARGGRRYMDERSAKLHGADFLVVGEILDVWSEASAFEGYGLSLQTDTTSAQIYVRVVKLPSETEVFSAEQIGTVEWNTTPFARATHSDRPAAAIREAVNQLVRDSRFADSFVEKVRSQTLPRMVTSDGVKIVFKTKGATVELDGRYVGVAPLTRTLNSGLEYVVHLAKPGFLPWEGRILAEPGLVVAPALEPVSKVSSSQNSVTNKP